MQLLALAFTGCSLTAPACRDLLALPGDVLLNILSKLLPPDGWGDVESGAVVHQDARAWLAYYRTLATLTATCRGLRDLIYSPPAEALWDELCLSSWEHLGPAEPKLQAYVERHSHRAANVNVFGDELDPDHLHRALAAITRMRSLDLFRVLTMRTVDEVSSAISTSGVQPTEAGVHLCALGPQLPSSVVNLKVHPLEAGNGWAWYQSIVAARPPACAGFIVHRYANLARLKDLAITLPSGWMMTASCCAALCRRFPVLQSLELEVPLDSENDLTPLAALTQRGCALDLTLEAAIEPWEDADQGAELLRLLKQLQHVQPLDSLDISIDSLSDAHQEQLLRLTSLHYLELSLDSPHCDREYSFPQIEEVEVHPRDIEELD